jgi:glucose-6-phosphate dehydrogenase assembly protein OpcA
VSSSVGYPPGEGEVPVDYAEIEKSLAGLWRGAHGDDEHALVRAALWNVVAHTDNPAHYAMVSEVLARASASVPQRTILIRADPVGPPAIRSWASATCHRTGAEKQVCSETIAIVASGDRIHRVPPLVSALLIPDMPVAMWWVGDLPNEQQDYVMALLEPADRLIVNSANFAGAADLDLLSGVAANTTTTPADLNWARLEDWRIATASIFDPPVTRPLLRRIRRVSIEAAAGSPPSFGNRIAAWLYAAWLAGQTGQEVLPGGTVVDQTGEVKYRIDDRSQPERAGSLVRVEMAFDDGSQVTIDRNEDCGIVRARCGGMSCAPETITHVRRQDTVDLIVRELKRPDDDRVFRRALPLAARMAIASR